MPDIEILRFIWWALVGVILMGFAVTDGFDLGAAILLPLIGRTDVDRRVILNAIGPFWEGNQVWIILGAGAIFAAWPTVYGVVFSSFYLLILLLLLTLGILRPAGIIYRSKVQNKLWRRVADWVTFTSGFAPGMIFGILVGNLLMGIPFSLDHQLHSTYSGSFLTPFTVFPLWCGVTSVMMLTMHGGLYLSLKTENPVRDRAILCAQLAAGLLFLLFAGGGIWIANVIEGYQVVTGADPRGFSNPLNKEVATQTGAWLNNYTLYPYTMAAPIIGLLGALIAGSAARWGKGRIAFLFSNLAIIGVIATVGVSMFPFILPSSFDTTSSLLVWDSSSSQLTLLIMLVATMFFLPLILIYTAWVYYALRGKVKNDIVKTDNHAY